MCMCGRYSLESADTILAELGLPGALADWRARFNVAPGTAVPCVLEDSHGRSVRHLRWGLVPGWAKDPSIGYKMINARAETVAEKPAFREALVSRRCLLPATGFYEWQGQGKNKRPHYLHQKNGNCFAFAGLWERWTDREQELFTVTIITTASGPVVAPIHDRMPVIVAAHHYADWLSPALTDLAAIASIVGEPDYRDVEAYEVSTHVNSVRHDGPELIERGPTQQKLF